MSEDLIKTALEACGLDFNDLAEEGNLVENSVPNVQILNITEQNSANVQCVSGFKNTGKPVVINVSQQSLVLNNKFITQVPLVIQKTVKSNVNLQPNSNPSLPSIRSAQFITNSLNQQQTLQLLNIQNSTSSATQRPSSPLVLKPILQTTSSGSPINNSKLVRVFLKPTVSNPRPPAIQPVMNRQPSSSVTIINDSSTNAFNNNLALKQRLQLQHHLQNSRVLHQQQILPKLQANASVPANILTFDNNINDNNNNKINSNQTHYILTNNSQKIMLNNMHLMKNNVKKNNPFVNIISNRCTNPITLTQNNSIIVGRSQNLGQILNKNILLKSELVANDASQKIENSFNPSSNKSEIKTEVKSENEMKVISDNSPNMNSILKNEVKDILDAKNEFKTDSPKVKFKIGADDEDEENVAQVDSSVVKVEVKEENNKEEGDDENDFWKALKELTETNKKAEAYEAQLKAKQDEEERKQRLKMLLGGDDVPLTEPINKPPSTICTTSVITTSMTTNQLVSIPSTNNISTPKLVLADKVNTNVFSTQSPDLKSVVLIEDKQRPTSFIESYTQKFGLRLINSNNVACKSSVIQQNFSLLPTTTLSRLSNPLQLHSSNNNLSMSSSSPSLVLVDSVSGKYWMQDGNQMLGHMRNDMMNKDVTRLWTNEDVVKLRHMSNLQRMNMNFIDEEVEEEELGHAETYSDYMPTKLKMGCKHPDPVVESASLSSVESPDVLYNLSIPEECIDRGLLSAVQLESITYACQKHESLLPSGERVGFLVGDGAGVGKGRMIAGIIFENYLCGRRRSLWLSVSNDLKVDAERDLKDIGATNIEVHSLNKFKYAKISSRINGKVKKGVIFATYSSLIGESKINNKYRTRLKQLIQWLGKEFDGLIIFDECHRAKNLFPNGSSKPTKTGQTVVELQNKLPKSRVVYASATGASEPRNMAYMVRLGLWGPGTPFKEFSDYIQAVEKRGVGAMEMVAMEMKQRGTYIARQLSFKGVSFHVEEVEISEEYIDIYNKSVQLWVEAREKFQQAAELLGLENRVFKTMWGQFWSSHQRFFKYLCISAKVQHCVNLSNVAVAKGKSVVIGLQSTGESRTLEMVDEKGDELNDFVSTAKGVFQKLVESHFPSIDRKGSVDYFTNGGLSSLNMASNISSGTSSPILPLNGKRKLEGDFKYSKKLKLNNDGDNEDEDDDSDNKSSSSDDDDEDDNDDDDDDDGSESDSNPFTRVSDSDEDVPWMRKTKKKKMNKKKKKDKKKKKSSKKSTTGGHGDDDNNDEDDKEDDDDDYDLDRDVDKILEVFKKKENFEKSVPASSTTLKRENSVNSYVNVDKVMNMKRQLLDQIERLGRDLPPNALDDLIDRLGGTSRVAEMTGRKGRIVSMSDGTIRYERRSEVDVPLEIINLTEKQRFMDGEKDVAIISEAASSGISLQADRRVANQKRRVHITLELPWSADRAIQQFGRTHRSNQVSAPEYIFLISELAGERRFASTVAKRLECLGALTQGDRRAAETRDLSQFNIDNKYGQTALEAVMKSVIGMESALVSPPSNYSGKFFEDVRKSLVGVGLINQNQNGYSLDKESYNISKFLNRILGIEVETQNALFEYFTSTMKYIVLKAKKDGKWDLGILDLGSSGEKVIELSHKDFHGTFSGFRTKITLNTISVERGLSWTDAERLADMHIGTDDGFYESKQSFVDNRRMYILALSTKRQHHSQQKKEMLFKIYRANTGLQSNLWTLQELKKKYNKVTDQEDVKHIWDEQYNLSEHQCLHVYQYGQCHKASTCEIGRRSRVYHVLSGSVLSVWTSVERVLASLPSGQASRMQIVRLRTNNNRRIVGTLIHPAAIDPLTQLLSSGRIDDNNQQQPQHSMSSLSSIQYQPSTPSSSSLVQAKNNNISMHNNFYSTSNLLNIQQHRQQFLQQQLQQQHLQQLQQQHLQQQRMKSSILLNPHSNSSSNFNVTLR